MEALELAIALALLVAVDADLFDGLAGQGDVGFAALFGFAEYDAKVLGTGVSVSL